MKHGEEGEVRTERGNWYICWICVEHRYALGKQVSCLGTYCICGCRAEHQESKGSTSVENATSDGEDGMILKSPLTFPTQQKYKVANETLEGVEMSIDAIGLDACGRLLEDEDEPELLQSDEKRLLDDEVNQIAGLLLDDGPEVLAGGRGDHAGEEDARPSSSKGKGDGHSKGDEKVAKSDLPHVSVGLPGDGITYVNDDGKEVKIDKAGSEDIKTSRVHS